MNLREMYHAVTSGRGDVTRLLFNTMKLMGSILSDATLVSFRRVSRSTYRQHDRKHCSPPLAGAGTHRDRPAVLFNNLFADP